MSIQAPKSPSIYAQEILTALQGTGIRQTNPGGKARAFADIVASKLGEIEARQFSNLSQTLLPFASGESLDLISEINGIRRVPRADAAVSTLDNNLSFYVRVGTFGDINNGQAITVPAGTRVTNSDGSRVYLLDGTYVLPANASRQVVSASSINTGEAGNSTAGEFTSHNFTNYSDAAFGSLLVTNDFGILGGRDEEDDESLRYRVSLKLQSAGGASEVDLRGAILQLAGIQDVVLQPLSGTYLVYVYGISPEVPPTLLQSVQDIINQTTAYPLSGTAVVPDLVGISLSTTVRLVSGLGQVDQAAILQAAATAAADYINNLQIGAPIVSNAISDRIRNADTKILDVGDPNKPLQEIFIWRSRLDGTRYSRFLVNNYTPKVGERIVVEGVTNAINLVIA